MGFGRKFLVGLFCRFYFNYSSPHSHDINSDGVLDIIIGGERMDMIVIQESWQLTEVMVNYLESANTKRSFWFCCISRYY